MARNPNRRKKEAVTVSFHYVVRKQDDKNEDGKLDPISDAEFADICKNLSKIHDLDFSTKERVDEVRFSPTVPITSFKKINDRTYFGTYMGVYTGHAYQNTAAGLIPADSASLRPFLFLIYLSVSGRLYIGTQYLGQFGSYTGLKNTILKAFGSKKRLDVRSFRVQNDNFDSVQAKEVIVEVSKVSESVNSKNRLSTKHLIVLKKQDANDDFEGRVQDKIIPLFKSAKDKRIEGLSKIMQTEGLIDVSDELIEDCTLVALVDGYRRNYYMMDSSSYATHFHISVVMTADGHPNSEDTKNAMLKLLENKIIKSKEDV